MKLPSLKTTQARIAILIGALALSAAFNAVIGIVNAAKFQQQLGELQSYTDSLEMHNQARTSLLKQQMAMKNMLISEEDWARDYGELFRHQNMVYEYLDLQAMQAEIDEHTYNLLEDSEAYEKQVSVFIDYLDDETNHWEEEVTFNREQVDPAVAVMESGVQILTARDLQALRDQIGAMEASTQNSAFTGQVALLVLAVLIVLGMFTTFDISRPLDGLTSAIVAFENKTYKPELLARFTHRPDELGQLASAVGGMAQSISESNRLKEQFLQAAQRFIPAQYLDFLEKDSITSVNLGDHVSAEMAVMFSDIRGFTTMSEKMTAKENFDFVNEYLKLVSPIIQKHEGFIVKFLGDGMMAIFPYGVADAVQAGIEKEEKVQEFNQLLKSRGLPEITVGIGIHTGNMMVGMIGDEMRMQGDAFSDNVNLTARIEGLNKFYGTSMIISEDTLRQLPGPVAFKMRYLGKAVVKGRMAPLGMYEVYEGLPEALIEAKASTREAFEQAITLYAEGSFAQAGQLFSQVLEKDPGDKTARYYLESCAEWVDRPRTADWNGAIVMDSK
jgi:class 3 adenylate cyclase